MVSEKKERCFVILDELIDDGIDVERLGEELKGSERYNYNTIRVRLRRTFGSVEKALEEYGINKSSSTPHYNEIYGCFRLDGGFKIYLDEFEVESLCDKHNISKEEFKTVSKKVLKDFEKESACVFVNRIKQRIYDDGEVLIVREDVPSYISVYIKSNYESLIGWARHESPYIYREGLKVYCGDCLKYRPVSEYPTKDNGSMGLDYVCKDCFNHSIKPYTLKRRSLLKKSEFNFGKSEMERVLSVFGGGCALTGSKENIHWDHVIPVTTGYGATTIKNMIPLRGDINISKKDSNFFDWFKLKGRKFSISKRKFNEVVRYLANVNGMSVESYREYVYWCHNNPKDLTFDSVS